MPEVDFMVVCDYVRGEGGGVLHMVAAGVDRITPSVVPAAHNLGVAIRLNMTRAECDRQHELQLIFQDEDGGRLMELNAEFSAPYPEGLPSGWRANAVVPLNIGVPLPAYGVYSFELLIDGQTKKSVPILVSPRPEPASAAGE